MTVTNQTNNRVKTMLEDLSSWDDNELYSYLISLGANLESIPNRKTLNKLIELRLMDNIPLDDYATQKEVIPTTEIPFTEKTKYTCSCLITEDDAEPVIVIQEWLYSKGRFRPTRKTVKFSMDSFEPLIAFVLAAKEKCEFIFN